MAKLTNTGASRNVAVGAATARNAVALVSKQRYLVTASTNCYCKQGDSAVTVAAADAGAFFLAAGSGVVIEVDDAASAFVACLQATAGGFMYLTLMEGGRE